MFDLNEDVFVPQPRIPADAKIIFVSDLYVDDYVGGAELTTEALLTKSPFQVHRLRSKEVTLKHLEEGVDRFWVFGNFTQLNPQLIPSIVGNLRYSILEYDFKYCKARSPEKHLAVAKNPCGCHNEMTGKIISAFFYGASHIWWMSEKQREKYMTLFPFLAEREQTVLSSVFDDYTLDALDKLRLAQEVSNVARSKWIVLGSDSWVKGAEQAKQWCITNQKDYEVVWNLPYEELLVKLSKAQGFVYLPQGGDTCPRMVIEAKLLGCELQLNDFVLHKDEDWFATSNLTDIRDYLATAAKTFWDGIRRAMEYKPTISGYTTTYNAASQGYPFIKSIKSMLEFCDEVNIADANSNDESTLHSLIALAYPRATTREALDLEIINLGLSSAGFVDFPDTLTNGAKKDPRINVRIYKDVSWGSKNSAILDGVMKARARSMCTKEFCWQMDSDELVHPSDAKRIIDMCRVLPAGADVLSLPVVEYWGSLDKVRVDVAPWKWRLSRNNKNITHGVPAALRRYDSDGNMFSAPGSDGCDMIDATTHEPVPHVSFYTQDIDNLRKIALLGNAQALQQYETWLNQAIKGLPTVFHHSWLDLNRKIKLYKNFWTKHWVELTGETFVDSAEQNMMFDVPWSEVTDEMIAAKAEELSHIGGWIWHRKWDGTKTPSVKVEREDPGNCF